MLFMSPASASAASLVPGIRSQGGDQTSGMVVAGRLGFSTSGALGTRVGTGDFVHGGVVMNLAELTKIKAK